ncbi:hemin ABC transporter substrate-binding protein [Falsochrobactrum ovis]|uniref:Iron complex transport system substrate-binding protein n=1 Tax=Falsochrobactrum ovis TaxID=1293442 RepID=A0A364JRM9_9HYPH|nr:ABC transporter substrate-binding protein [Falsochrobactrum ovis]RAK24685.1 iron complex transport system substrate-binding protein [Falsochrobactrum ovis]
MYQLFSFQCSKVAYAALALFIASTDIVFASPFQKFEDTSRIVSIGGSITEIIYALGAEELLVARDQTSTYPEEATALADVGYMRRLSPEGVLSVNPSGILMLEGSGPQETIDVLNRASVPIVTVPDAHSAESVIQKIEIVGQALGLDQEARKLADSVAKNLNAVQKLIENKKERKRVLFILSAQGGRINAAGKGTAADGIIRLSGGVNAIDAFEGYKQLTDEAIDKAAPDVILTMNIGADSVLNEDLLKNPALAHTPAGRNNKIIQMNSLYLLGFGPRTGAASRELAQKLYGTGDEK